jgi:dihydropteroate synthase
LRLRALGADLVDVGGESTRPGAQRVSLDEEHARVVPVIEALAQEGVRCSVDTMRAAVAEAAVTAGATLVNDVSGGLADPAMLPTVAALGVPYVAMHWRGHAADMQSRASYDDVVTEVCAELSQRLDACAAAGVADVVVDPGIGFAKTAEHNWQLLRHVDRLQALGPVLLGSSRKAFLGTLLDGRPPVGRDAATTALTVVAAQAGCWGVRVHDVQGSADAVRVWEQLRG